MRNTPYMCPNCSSRLPRAASRCFFCENPVPLDKGSATSLRVRNAQSTRREGELPRVYIPAGHFGRLTTLADMALQDEALGKLLRRELTRAVICGDAAMPSVVRIGSRILVRDRSEDGSVQKIHGVLVWPHECDPQLPSITVSSLLGAAVLGLRAGDVMPYVTENGTSHVAAILEVFPSESGETATQKERKPALGSNSENEQNVVRLVKKLPTLRPRPPADPDDPPPAA